MNSIVKNTTALRIGILNGDDIGHEIVPASVEISRAAAEVHGVAIDWYPLPIGRAALETHGHTLPPGTLEALKSLDGWILGADRPPRLPQGAQRDQPASDPAQVVQPVRQRAADALLS
jgi:3-isopropylmalate dehydrogenase